MGYMGEAIWPECFNTGKINPKSDDKAIISDGMVAWANCMIGNTPPETFGKVMVAIGQRFGIVASSEGLSKYAHDQGWLK